MAEDFVIRKVEDDAGLSAIRALAFAIWPGVYGALLPPGQVEYMLDWMYGLEAMRREMAAGVVWLLAEANGVPVGYAAFGPGAAPGEVKLHKLYLLERMRGHGHGKRLIGEVKRLAAASGGRALRLSVNKGNVTAIAAYRACGLEQLGSVRTEIGGGYCMDDYIFGCTLSV